MRRPRAFLQATSGPVFPLSSTGGGDARAGSWRSIAMHELKVREHICYTLVCLLRFKVAELRARVASRSDFANKPLRLGVRSLVKEVL